MLTDGLRGQVYPVTFSDELGWLIDVDVALSLEQMQAVARYAHRVNLERWVGMSLGDRKDRVGKALGILDNFIKDKREHGAGKVRQRITVKGFPFHSTERLHPDRTFFLPEVRHG